MSGETRKLTTILAADVVGYSRLAAADEERTLARLRALRSDLIDPAISLHHGRVVKRTGDGILIEFRSVVDAVRCAIEVQNGMVERNAGLPPDRQIQFRVGIHLGDVVEESDGDLMGDGVNIAARLEGIAKPGTIYISDDAYRQVRARLDLAVSDLGETQLKNIPLPMRVYSLEVGLPAQPKPTATPPAEPLPPPPQPKPASRKLLVPVVAGLVGVLVVAAVAAWYFLMRPTANIAANAPAHLSIVVLPFQNLSNDPKQDYFADGITDNLTTDLSRIRNSFVIARNTAFTYKGKSVDAKEIGKDLGVRYVLEGSVQRDGNRVRVNAQLIDAETGAHLWADRFEEELPDLFKLQDDVVARLANALGDELVNAEARRASRSANPDAVGLTMQGWALLNKFANKAANEDAQSLFEEAIRLDPKDDDAFSGLAYVYERKALYGWAGTQTDEAAKKSGEYADRAIALNPANASAYFPKSYYLSHHGRAAEGLAAADEGLAQNPSFAWLYEARAIAAIALARYEQARSDLLQMLRLDPKDEFAATASLLLANVDTQLGNNNAAAEMARKALSGGYRTWGAFAYLASAEQWLGKSDQAAADLKLALDLNPKLTVKWVTAHTILTPRVIEGLRKAGLPDDDGPRLSIVVLPFQNLSGDAKQDYLADVLTDELTTYISRIPGSFVIARNTAFTYKGKPTDAKEIGKDLGVRYALEGSVQPTDKRIRTNAQLIDTETGAHLWAEEFDTDKTDLLQTEDEIVTRLARTLQIQLIDIEAGKLRGAHPVNSGAQEFALRCEAAAFYYAVGNPTDTTFGLCEQALTLDHDNVLALAILSQKYALSVISSNSVNREADIGRADELASRALALDPNSPDAHTAKAGVLLAKKKFDEAQAEAQRAIALDPSSMSAYTYLCFVDLYTAQGDQLIACSDKVLALSPRDPQRFQWLGSKGIGYFILGQDNLAIEWLNRSLALNPTALPILAYLAAALALSGKDAEARQAFSQAKSVPGAKSLTIAVMKQRPNGNSPAYFAMRERLYQGLRKAGMPEQ